jgi:serine carboxypeptidase-like clade I
LNRRDVQKALHVSHAPIAHWTKHSTNETLDYVKEFNACNRNAKPDAPSMIDVYRKIVPQLDKTWIYNGDTDPAVSYEGTRTAVKQIGFRELDGGGYRPWFYNRTATSRPVLQHKPVRFGPDLVFQNLGAQFGGEVVNYEHNLAFLTVHGSGHMVPQFRPQAALHLLTKLVHYSSFLSPLLPSNATLSNMSGKEFATFLDAWTESAKAAPFV